MEADLKLQLPSQHALPVRDGSQSSSAATMPSPHDELHVVPFHDSPTPQPHSESALGWLPESGSHWPADPFEKYGLAGLQA